ncbi:MAG: hypothetical protein ACFFFB_23030 [Candidatus Heimdallarchaeota archaeon]
MRSAVSTLCLGPGGLFFQSGTVLSGIFAVLFVISLNWSFNEYETNEKLKKLNLYIALISCTTFIGLGAFCGSNPIIALIHGSFAVISWLSGLFYVISFTILMFQDSQYLKLLVYIGCYVSFVLFLLVFTFFLHFFPSLRFLMIILPSLEWINTISLIFWYFAVSVYMIYKKI